MLDCLDLKSSGFVKRSDTRRLLVCRLLIVPRQINASLARSPLTFFEVLVSKVFFVIPLVLS